MNKTSHSQWETRHISVPDYLHWDIFNHNETRSVSKPSVLQLHWFLWPVFSQWMPQSRFAVNIVHECNWRGAQLVLSIKGLNFHEWCSWTRGEGIEGVITTNTIYTSWWSEICNQSLQLDALFWEWTVFQWRPVYRMYS